jgi:hypothetical protein
LLLGLAPQLGLGAADPGRSGAPKPILMLRDRGRSTYRATFESISAASVARWRMGADGCNTMVGFGARPRSSPIGASTTDPQQ